MKTINRINSAAITALAIDAHFELTHGVQAQFTRLMSALDTHRKQFIESSKSMYPSLDRLDLESMYMNVVWREVRRYRDDSKGAFLQMLNHVLPLRAKDLVRKGAKKRLSEESLDKAVEEHGDAAYQLANAVTYDQSDDSFSSPEAEEAWLNERLDTIGVDGAVARTVAIQRYRNDASYDEIVSLMPHFFRNKQQAHRAVAGQARWR